MSEGTGATIRVVAAVVERSGRYLLGRRPADKRHGGLWEFPGGKLRPGESLLDGARRELDEELAVGCLECGTTAWSGRDPGSVYLIEFVPVRIDGEPRAREHAEIGWFTPAELLEMALAPSDRAFAERLAEAADGG